MSQKQMVIEKLKVDGHISRNWALSKFCSRLGAIINVLKNEGWSIEGKWDNHDYYYRVVGSPLKKVIYSVPELNKQITIYE